MNQGDHKHGPKLVIIRKQLGLKEIFSPLIEIQELNIALSHLDPKSKIDFQNLSEFLVIFIKLFIETFSLILHLTLLQKNSMYVFILHFT